MSLPFAEHLAAFAQTKGIETGTISKIAQNPDQSKHLETATLKIFGLDIDLVNLRSEEYTNESRIPTEVVSAFTRVPVMSPKYLSLSELLYKTLCGEILRSTLCSTIFILVQWKISQKRFFNPYIHYL
jgi:hypothetical protein